MTEHIITMSAEEVSEFLSSDFDNLDKQPKRLVATMMALILDHNEFLANHGLEEQFDKEYDTDAEELH